MMGALHDLMGQTQRSAQRLSVVVAGVVATVAISACTSPPSKAPANAVASARADLPLAFSEAARTGAPQQAGTPNDPLDRWWTRFSDPLIDRWVDEALQKNDDIAVAQARLMQARALAERTQADASPSLRLETSASQRRLSEDEGFPGPSRTVNTLSTQARVSWEIDLFDRAGASGRAAGARAEASQADQAGVRIIVSTEVVRHALAARAGQARLKIAQDAVSAAQALAEIAQARTDAGLAMPLDGLRGQAQLQEAQADETSLRSNLNATLAALAALLHGTTSALADQLVAAPDIGATHPHLGAVLPGELLRRRPDVRQAEALLRAAGADVDAINASRWPTLKVDASAGLAGATLSALTGPGAAVGALTGALAGTLFDGGRLAADRERAEEAQQEATAKYRQVVHRSFVEADAALADVAVSARYATTMAAAAQLQTQASKVTESQYRAGLSDAGGWLEAQRAQLRALDRSAQAAQALAVAWVAVYTALGGDT